MDANRSKSNKLSDMKDKLESNPMLFIGIQILIGLLIAWIIYYISLSVLQADKLVIDNKFDANKRTKTEIFTGYMDSSALYNVSYNASVDTADSFVPMRHSVNLKGGSQFTYQFWVNVGDPEALNEQVIFLRGDPNIYNYTVVDNVQKTTRNVKDFISFCPMLTFGPPGEMGFKLYFNTVHNIKQEMVITTLKSDNDVLRQNMLSLFPQKWVLITIVFEDNMPISDFESGLMVKFYVNDTVYKIGRYPTMLRQNEGNFYMMPDTVIPQVKLADLSYFNYALDDATILKTFRKGFTDRAAQSQKSSVIPANMLSDINRLEYANT